jgi:hypothetical protein
MTAGSSMAAMIFIAEENSPATTARLDIISDKDDSVVID